MFLDLLQRTAFGLREEEECRDEVDDGRDIQKMLRQALSLKAKIRAASDRA
jgi:hypothetical protein